jgi:hypothetical protein
MFSILFPFHYTVSKHQIIGLKLGALINILFLK